MNGERWVNENGDEITMTRLPDNGGLHVKLTTSRDDIAETRKQQKWFGDIGSAAGHAAWLAVDLVDGDTWSRTSLLDTPQGEA
jgi:hypothetical protein